MQETLVPLLEALACDKRLLVLDWLRNPRAHFPRRRYGDLVRDGVCGVSIAEKLGISPSTTSRHMKQLTGAGLVRAKRIRQWTFYRRDEDAIKKMKDLMRRSL
jgi:ArsR family transcriptional regulator